MNARGYNPIRWNCDDQGCFNQHCRFKIENLANCLPVQVQRRGIAFSDIDAVVEINRFLLFLEFKSDKSSIEIKTGQRLLFANLTLLSTRITVVVVRYDVETMIVRAIRVVRNGKFGPWEIVSQEDFHRRIHNWADAVSRIKR